MDARNQQHPSRCIWMDAGVVAYKLCDLDFRCDECPFDMDMRHPHAGIDREGELAGAGQPVRSPLQSVEKFFEAFEPVQFPGDRTYAGGHLWIRYDNTDIATIGMDHVAASLVGPFVSIILPGQPMHLVEHSPCCWLVHREGTISLSSPVNGTILSVNKEVTDRPSLLSEKPYTGGWILKARLADRQKRKTHRSASENASHVTRELAALKDQLVPFLQPRPGIGPTALDGGLPIQSPLEMIGPAAFALIARMFL